MHTMDAPKLIQPRDHKAKISIWADLSVSDMDVLSEAVTPDQIKAELARIFHLEDHAENLKSGILLDMFFYLIQFSRDNLFSKEQTSAFFSIVKQTHEVCTETPFGNVEHTFRYFRELVLCHAVKRPPYSIDLFTPDQVAKITEYVINTYFRHFKMYKYVFTPMVRLDLSMTYVGLPESPPSSEAGDVTEQQDGEAIDGAEDEGAPGVDSAETKDQTEAETGEPVRGLKADKQQQTYEESPAAKELRTLIKQHLSDELAKLRLDVEQQIKESEESINTKLLAAEGGSKGRVSAKGKKK